MGRKRKIDFSRVSRRGARSIKPPKKRGMTMISLRLNKPSSGRKVSRFLAGFAMGVVVLRSRRQTHRYRGYRECAGFHKAFEYNCATISQEAAANSQSNRQGVVGDASAAFAKSFPGAII
jgi:hypothetical protein